jgi:hypothetical protein
MVMKIEDEISQKKFKSEFQNSCKPNFYSQLDTYHIKNFFQIRFTAQQFNILRILRGQYPKTSTVNLLKNVCSIK